VHPEQQHTTSIRHTDSSHASSKYNNITCSQLVPVTSRSINVCTTRPHSHHQSLNAQYAPLMRVLGSLRVPAPVSVVWVRILTIHLFSTRLPTAELSQGFPPTFPAPPAPPQSTSTLTHADWRRCRKHQRT
jgi:hypothetical protein